MRKIDGDSHFYPAVRATELTRRLPGLSAAAAAAIARDAATFAHPAAHRGGFRTSTGRDVDAPERGGDVSGIEGHGDPAARVRLLPATGFEVQVLIPDRIFANPFGSPLARAEEPGLRLALCQLYNDATAEAQAQFPEQLIGTAVVPFQDVAESCAEARRAVRELGLKAVTINGNWGGRNYDALDLYPFWETISDLGVPLYVHHNPFLCQVYDHWPTTHTLGGERLRRLHISNYLGFAFEYMVGMAALTLGGVLTQFPDLKFCFFEAGGSWLPWVWYQLDHVWRVEPQCARCDEAPSAQLRRSCWVAVEPDEGPLVQAVAAIGADNFIVGSDYPHPPSTYPNTVAGIERMALPAAAKEAILGRNLERVLQLA
jgi:aminocarboxymuconate-semialdehyde decarboxylase